jgi:hypothetical protein
VWTAAGSLLAWLWLLLCQGFFWRTDVRLPSRVEPDEWPSVCVVVPARDEAAVLPAALPSLLAQDYPGRAADGLDRQAVGGAPRPRAGTRA